MYINATFGTSRCPCNHENVKRIIALNNAFFLFQWVPEISHHCQKTPFLLVGTQIDLRDDAATIDKLAKNKQKPISIEQGDKLQKELRAVKYVECSALTQVRIGKDSKSHFEKEQYLSSQIKAFSGTKYGVHVPILILQ